MFRKNISKTGRRDVLKLTAASLAGLATAGTGSAKNNRNSKPIQTIKGTVNNPIKRKHIENQRELFLNSLKNRKNAPKAIVLDKKPVPEGKTLIGYALGIEKGEPVERTYPIDNSLLESKTDNASHVTEKILKGQHKGVERFAANHGGK